MGGVLWYSRFLYSVVYCILWFSHFFNHRFSGYIRYFVPPRYGYQVRIYGWYFALFASPSPPSPRSQPPHGAGTDSGKDSGGEVLLNARYFFPFCFSFSYFCLFSRRRTAFFDGYTAAVFLCKDGFTEDARVYRCFYVLSSAISPFLTFFLCRTLISALFYLFLLYFC